MFPTSDETGVGRIPPQAVEIEMAVLGAMLIEKDAVSRAVEVLQPEDFYKPAHQKIFETITTLFDRSEPVDLITTVEELRRRGTLDTVGGPAYITELTQRVTTAANVEFHAHIILEKSLMRSLIGASADVSSRAFSETEDPLELLDEAESKIFQISERRMRKTFTPLKVAIYDALHVLESIHGKHQGVTGVPTGFPDLDALTGGFQRSDLIIVAGRPSQGKTALALALARNAGLHHEKKTAIGLFSLEMSKEQLVIRMLASEGRVNAHKLRTGKLPDEDWRQMSRAAGRLAEAKLFIDDTPALSILELRAKARRLKVEHGIGMIVVDYLQLVHGPRNAENREREISWISRSLKALAKELDIPVIALSQLNRSPETRADKRPLLSDLRESGAIEQDADLVMFVHRPEMFGLKEMKDDDGNILSTEGLAEIIIGKQRNGPTGTVRLYFHREYAGFEKLAPASFEPSLLPPMEESPAPF